MGNYINVNLDDIESAAGAVDAYIMKRAMLLAQMDSDVDQIRSAWRAEDADAFLLQWDAMKSSDGVFTVTAETLTRYRDILRAAHELYKKAQAESVEQASKIGGWT